MQCPRCLDHKRESIYKSQKSKLWLIERCAHCRYNFDIEEWKGKELPYGYTIEQNDAVYDCGHRHADGKWSA